MFRMYVAYYELFKCKEMVLPLNIYLECHIEVPFCINYLHDAWLPFEETHILASIDADAWQ